MLRWNHHWGTKAEYLQAQVGMGRRVPAGFADRPEVKPVAAFYWTAFCDLESERSFGMAAGPIPRSRARDYAIEHGIDDADGIAEFWHIIVRLDGAASRIRRPKDDEGLSDKVSVQDTGGVKNMMRNLGRKRRR